MRLPIAIIAILSGMTITAMEKDPVPQNPTAAMSPNARSFQRYGDIPVSLYTGTPSINIPLATLREGELSLPIELSYHSGGIKADEHPGWTGLGWTLIAGGAITREVRGIPDESRTYGYRTVCSHLKLDNLTSSSDLSGFIQDKDGTVTYPMYDTEPDKFSFQFPGYSGYFMMGTDGEWHVFSDRPLQVNSDVPSVPSVKFPNGRQTSALNEPCYKTFILTADDGTEYIFGKTAVDYSINSMAQSNSSWEATAWYLVEIRGLNGQNIVLDYERGDFVVNFSRSVYIDFTVRIIHTAAQLRQERAVSSYLQSTSPPCAVRRFQSFAVRRQAPNRIIQVKNTPVASRHHSISQYSARRETER